MKRVLDYDPETRTTVWHEYDPLTKVTTIAEIQDAEHVIESNKAIQVAGVSKGKLNAYSKSGIKENWWHVGSIPNGVIAQWRKEGINIFDKNCWPAVKKKLNDPEWRYLRTGTGKV